MAEDVVMREFADFADAVKLALSECARILAVDAIRATVIELCERSLVWVYEHDPMTYSNDPSTYLLTIPVGARICHIWGIEGHKNLACSRYDVEPYRLNMDTKALVFNQDPYLRDRQILPVFSLKPDRDTLSCPEFLYQDFFDEVVSGAIVKLLENPSTTWAQQYINIIPIHRARFESGVERGIERRNDGLGMARPTNRVKAYYI